MSNHHNKQFFITHYQQKNDARVRRQRQQAIRQQSFETKRAAVQTEVRDWVYCQVAVLMAWFISIAGMTVSWFNFIVRRIG